MRIKSFFLLICLGVASILYAAPPQKYSKEELEWVKTSLADAVVLGELERYATEFAEGRKGQPLSPTMGRFYIDRIQRFQNYYFFEHDTKLDGRWLVSAVKYMEALVKARSELQNLEGIGKKDTPEYKKWVDYYRQTAAGLQQGVKKPGKVTDADKLKRLGIEKRQVLEAVLKAEKQQKQQQQKSGTAPQPYRPQAR